MSGGCLGLGRGRFGKQGGSCDLIIGYLEINKWCLVVHNTNLIFYKIALGSLRMVRKIWIAKGEHIKAGFLNPF